MKERLYSLDELLPAGLRSPMGTVRFSGESVGEPSDSGNDFGEPMPGPGPIVEVPMDGTGPTPPVPPMPGRALPVATNYASGNVFLSGDAGFVLDGVSRGGGTGRSSGYVSDPSGFDPRDWDIGQSESPSLGNPPLSADDRGPEDMWRWAERRGIMVDPGYASPLPIPEFDDDGWVNGQVSIGHSSGVPESEISNTVGADSGEGTSDPHSKESGIENGEPPEEFPHEEPSEDEPDAGTKKPRRRPPSDCKCQMTVSKGTADLVLDLTSDHYSTLPDYLLADRLELLLEANTLELSFALKGSEARDTLVFIEKGRSGAKERRNQAVTFSTSFVRPAICGNTYKTVVSWKPDVVIAGVVRAMNSAKTSDGVPLEVEFKATIVGVFAESIQCELEVSLTVKTCNPASLLEESRSLQAKDITVSLPLDSEWSGDLEFYTRQGGREWNIEQILKRDKGKRDVTVGEVMYKVYTKCAPEYRYLSPGCCCFVAKQARVELVIRVGLAVELHFGRRIDIKNGIVFRLGQGIVEDAHGRKQNNWIPISREEDEYSEIFQSAVRYIQDSILSSIERVIRDEQVAATRAVNSQFPFCDKSFRCEYPGSEFSFRTWISPDPNSAVNAARIKWEKLPIKVRNWESNEEARTVTPEVRDYDKDADKTRSEKDKQLNELASDKIIGCSVELIVMAVIASRAAPKAMAAARVAAAGAMGLPARYKAAIVGIVEAILLESAETYTKFFSAAHFKDSKWSSLAAKLTNVVAQAAFFLCLAKLIVYGGDRFFSLLSESDPE